MMASHSAWRRFRVAMLLLVPVTTIAQSGLAPNPVDLAQEHVVAYVDKLADLHCTEDVVQQKLKPNGNAELSERSQYDYFLLMQGDGDAFQLSESRLEVSSPGSHHVPLLLTNGFSTLSLVFHPYYRNSFEFEPGPVQMLDGKSAVPVHFAHIAGMRTPAALALRGREFPLDLQGTAWLDAQSGQVVRIDATLLHDMSDVGLRALSVHVEYATSLKGAGQLMLPSLAVVDLETPRQHWHNTHTFRDYKMFSAEAIQDPDVKIHPSEAAKDPNAPSSQTTDAKEKP